MQHSWPCVPILIYNTYELSFFGSSGGSFEARDTLSFINLRFIPIPCNFMVQVRNLLQTKTALLNI